MIKMLKKIVRKVSESKKPELTWTELQDRVRKNNHDWIMGQGEYLRKK